MKQRPRSRTYASAGRTTKVTITKSKTLQASNSDSSSQRFFQAFETKNGTKKVDLRVGNAKNKQKEYQSVKMSDTTPIKRVTKQNLQ